MMIMRSVLALSMLVTWFCGVSAATGYIDPISPVDDYRQEVGYFHAETDFEAREPGFPDLTLVQNAVYAQVEIPVEQAAAFYVRLLAANAQLDQDETTVFDDRYRPAGGAGIKGTLGANPHVNLGYFVEGTYHSRYSDASSGEHVEFEDFWDATTGLALQLQYGGVGVYGGPFAYYGSSSLEIKDAGVTTDSYYRSQTQGLRAGIKIPLAPIAYLTLDGTFGDRTLWGGSLNFVGLDL